jgi:hypothetical protein
MCDGSFLKIPFQTFLGSLIQKKKLMQYRQEMGFIILYVP